MEKLDLIDRKILAELMRDATQPIAQIAERVGLSQTPCWKRIQRLESAGIVEGRVAIVDPARIGLGLTVFVGIEAPDHGADWREAFAAAVRDIPRSSRSSAWPATSTTCCGSSSADMAAFDALYRRLTEAVADQERHLALRDGADQDDDRLPARHSRADATA